MKLESRMAMSLDEVKAVEQLMKTFDRFGMMPPYLITVEKWPKAYISDWSEIEYDAPEKTYGVIIRIIGQQIFRIQVVEDEDGN